MPPRLQHLLARLGRLEKTLFVFVALYALFSMWKPGSLTQGLLWLAMVVVGTLVLFRVARRGVHRLIWRLRNRLIVAYLFIAAVPFLLVLSLVAVSADAIIGQMAVYLVNTELMRRTGALVEPAAALTRTSEGNREEVVRRITPLIRNNFPKFELLIRGPGDVRYPADSNLEPPPAGSKSSGGLTLRGNLVYAWAHSADSDTDVTLMAPITHELLTSLVPNLGEVNLLRFYDGGGIDKVPPPVNFLDFRVNMPFPFTLPVWGQPEVERHNALIVTTRPSAVFGVVFGQHVEWGEQVFSFVVAIALIFLMVEIASLVAGVRLTRTITSAVHELYEGTQRVKEGDFSHRIPVTGSDQLAELGASFNTMTENLGLLMVVAKEKERLQSELEIAREVQNQLFPKNAPRMRRLEITGSCSPARMVSGDYYDFITLSDIGLAFAIGDVAGKGISAALLMAAIQSTMRTQLTSMPVAAAVGGSGKVELRFSTAEIVSQLNRQLYANTSPEKYATFCFGLYDDSSRVLTYTNAGHLPPMLVRGSEIEMLEVTGTVVGAFPVAHYEEKKIRLDPGQMLVAYTDGIVEPENVYGEMFGDDRLKDLLVKHGGASADEIIARVMESVVEWTGAGELQDDMTMVIARPL